ncbi:MAG: Ig-like domain-containing protein [Planctomycetota bacterium]|jgi:hypothetical protein
MRTAHITSLLTGLALLVAAGCSNGSQDQTSSVRIRCFDGQAFCIISCDLGCTQTGCAVSEISENQRLRFKFSDRVDPASVNFGSISIRTATGVAPNGDFVVNGSEVVFVPKVSSLGGVSSFGFQRNESYIITLAGGATAAQGVRSLTGDRLSQEFSCTVVASRGVLDEDGLPPTVSLLSPTVPTGAPRNPTIVLRFSELIDTTPLQSSLSAASPIRVTLRGLLPDGACNLDGDGTSLEGVPSLSTERVNDRDVTVVAFTPSVQLPGQSCVTVFVTADLRDLSGRSATPAQFQFITEAGTPIDFTIREQFNSSANQEVLVSGGTWSAGARPGLIGGDGRHGSFRPDFPSAGSGGANVFVWNVGNGGAGNPGFTIPANNTPSGQSFEVTDGRFFFTDFVLPEGATLRFTGTEMPQIFVRGQCDIRGTIDVSGVDMPGQVGQVGLGNGQRVSTFNARGAVNAVTAGQAGSAGGPGGGAGGRGGNECAGNGVESTTVGSVLVFTNDGQRGTNVRLRANHAYAVEEANTGGAGSNLAPDTGLNATALTQVVSVWRGSFSRGGGGGGYMLAGVGPTQPIIGTGTGTQPFNSAVLAQAENFPLLPYPATPPANYSSLNHFLVGGSGGGGGGSHTFGLLQGSAATAVGERFLAGHGGSGGGGAIAIRAGGTVTIGATATLLARGGDGVLIMGDDPIASSTVQDTNFGISSPGGGGSGGSLLVQSGKTISLAGTLNTRGGNGSRVAGITTATLAVVAQAGNGSNGFYRLEAAEGVNGTPAAASVPAYVVANNVGPLLDRDDATGDLSKWRGTGLFFPPTWLSYELDVEINGDGVVTRFGDGAGLTPANDPTGAVRVRFQGAKLNQAGTTPVDNQVTPWTDFVGTGNGLNSPTVQVNGFRFELLYNRAAFPNVIVRELRVFARS